MNEQHSMARLVRELRELNGLTREKFAARVGLTSTKTNHWKIERLLCNLENKGEGLHKVYFAKEA